jgi:hypothetical protein
LIQLKKSTPPFLGVFVLVGLALSPAAHAVVPAPDGGYPNFNTAEGTNALKNLTTGVGNAAVGWYSLFSNTDGSFNTAVGTGTLLFNIGDQSTGDGTQNTALGAAALLFNTTGLDNTASGSLALFHNTIGNNNTANGASALSNNTEGGANTAIGDHALFNNTSGDYNTATGLQSLLSNTTGDFNTATGLNALYSNTEGIENTANGVNALFNNTIGAANTADGANALFSNMEGAANTAIGQFALYGNTTGNSNTAVGLRALFNTIGSANTALGYNAGFNVTTAEAVIAIGHPGYNVSNTTWIGNVYGVTTQSGTTAPVIVSVTGQLGTVASSERFKKDIATMEKASEAILSLRPVTFHYRTDTTNTPQFGLVAEEVAKVNPALVLPDKEGRPYSVRYDQVNAMLLNEFLKEHRKVEEQRATIAQLKQDFQSRLSAQQKQIESLTAGLQKVSAQLEASKPATQVVKNP